MSKTLFDANFYVSSLITYGRRFETRFEKILIKLSLPGLVKHDESDTSQRSFQVFGLGQCYIPGITHFTSVDTFIQQTLISGVNYSRFTHYIQNTFILAEKFVPILRGIDMHYNTGRLEPSPRLETGNYFFSLFAVSFLCYNCQNYLVLIIYFFFRNLTGKLKALFKYEDKSDIHNCRPITALPKVSKILERVLHQHLYALWLYDRAKLTDSKTVCLTL